MRPGRAWPGLAGPGLEGFCQVSGQREPVWLQGIHLIALDMFMMGSRRQIGRGRAESAAVAAAAAAGAAAAGVGRRVRR